MQLVNLHFRLLANMKDSIVALSTGKSTVDMHKENAYDQAVLYFSWVMNLSYLSLYFCISLSSGFHPPLEANMLSIQIPDSYLKFISSDK